MTEKVPTIQLGCQNTGNPILDSLVNLLIARSKPPYTLWNEQDFKALHAMLLEAGNKEPDGLRRWQGAR